MTNSKRGRAGLIIFIIIVGIALIATVASLNRITTPETTIPTANDRKAQPEDYKTFDDYCRDNPELCLKG